MEIMNTMDFLWLSSSAVFWFMCFFPLVPFPVRDAIQAITSFICTVGQSASSFASSMSHITLPIFQKAELKAGWELLSGPRVLVLNAAHPVICIIRQSSALHSLVRPWLLSCGLPAVTGLWHPGQMSKNNYQLLTPGTAGLFKMRKPICLRVGI